MAEPRLYKNIGELRARFEETNSVLDKEVGCDGPFEGGVETVGDAIDYTLAIIQEALDMAAEKGEKQTFVDARTCKPSIVCYPSGEVEYL